MPDSDDRPLIKWHVHMDNWTAVGRRGVCARVNTYQEPNADPPYWYWAVFITSRLALPWIDDRLPGRWDTAEEAKEVVEDLLGDELAGWPGPV